MYGHSYSAQVISRRPRGDKMESKTKKVFALLGALSFICEGCHKMTIKRTMILCQKFELSS